MTDNNSNDPITNTPDDVYNDPDNILTNDDTVEPLPSNIPEKAAEQPSTTPFLPEKQIYPQDSRGPILEVDPEASPDSNSGTQDNSGSDLDASRLSNTNESPDGMTASE